MDRIEGLNRLKATVRKDTEVDNQRDATACMARNAVRKAINSIHLDTY